MAYLVLIFYSDNPIFCLFIFSHNHCSWRWEYNLIFDIYSEFMYGDNSDAGISDAIDNFLSTKAVKI